MIVEDTLDGLGRLPGSPVRDEYLSFVGTRGADALRRNGGPEHITASCFVFSENLQKVLLCFHRKGRFWVQFGGHVEADDESLAAAARREAREESGIAGLELLTTSIIDLDRHTLGGGFSCEVHWDIGFVAVTSTTTLTTASDESEDVRWFLVGDLPSATPAGFARRLLNIQQATPGSANGGRSTSAISG